MCIQGDILVASSRIATHEIVGSASEYRVCGTQTRERLRNDERLNNMNISKASDTKN